MTIDISLAMQRWLQDKGLAYYIRVAEVLPHPNSQDMARKLNIDTITNASIRKKLGLFRSGECHFEIPATGALERYFGEYSVLAKAYRTRDATDPFFCELAKFLLEVGSVHTNAFRMPKQNAAIFIATFQGHTIDWGVIKGPALRMVSMCSRPGRNFAPSSNRI